MRLQQLVTNNKRPMKKPPEGGWRKKHRFGVGQLAPKSGCHAENTGTQHDQSAGLRNRISSHGKTAPLPV
jgi:hypothetical protein